MKIAKSIIDLIGHTPLLEPVHLEEGKRLGARILLKLERANPAGSAKDRAALYMLKDAIESGKLAPGGTVIESTSGNTGVAIAALSGAFGCRVILTMPESMSLERRMLLKAYGAELVLTPASEGMAGAVRKAEELLKEIPGSIAAGQFINPSNPKAHFETTGPEIWEDTEGRIDFFVAGVGTGGTLTGTGRYLKLQNPAIRVVAVEPASSPLLSEGKAGPHGLMGIGANFIPEALDRSVYDEILTVTEDEAYAAGRLLAQKEGILAGITSGAALHAAAVLAAKEENAGKTIVALLPDTGERYLSTPMFQ